jgi:hypothetical protein
MPRYFYLVFCHSSTAYALPHRWGDAIYLLEFAWANEALFFDALLTEGIAQFPEPSCMPVEQ